MNERWTLRQTMALVWLSLVLTAVYFFVTSGRDLKEIPGLIESQVSRLSSPFDLLFFFVLYLLRPLIFFPSLLLAIATGLCFGSLIGGLVIMIGENLNAYFSYLIGRYMAGHWWECFVSKKEGMIKKWEKNLKQNSFMAILIMRLFFLPFDPLNYTLGMMRVKLKNYLVATFLGILPGLISLSMIGASTRQGEDHRVIIILIGVGIFCLGLMSAFILRHFNSFNLTNK